MTEANIQQLTHDTRAAKIQSAIHTYISTDIMHRRAIERWATGAGMHRSQHRMLMYLSKCETTPSQKDLAKHFDISPAAVTVTLQKLEGDGYIERGKNVEKTDTRQNEIRITEKGRAEITETGKYFRLLDSQTFDGFESDEIETLISYLERIQKNLSSLEEKDSKNTSQTERKN